LPQNLQVREYLYELAVLMQVPYKEFLQRFYEAENIINIDLNIKKKIKDFSAGQKKLFSAVLAITIDPDVVFFDEPTANLDIKNKLIIIEIIKQMISQERIIVITTHLVDEIKDLINDIIILDNHQIVYDKPFDGKAEDIKKVFTAHTTEIAFDPENKLNNFLNKKEKKEKKKEGKQK
jgi:ABC-2 type transport system ATP-binding protein